MNKKIYKQMVIYSHDTFGLGNIRRMLAITEYLLNKIPDLSILLITGSPMIHNMHLPKNRFDYLKLPVIGRTSNGEYVAKKLGTNFDDLVKLRSQLIKMAVSNFNPDVMIVDKKPRGIADELHATLDMIHHNMPATSVVLLLRDILDDPKVTRRIWLKNRYFQSIARYYHSVLVMGSKKVFDVCQEYDFPVHIADIVQFCGYINRNHIFSKITTPLLFNDVGKPKILVTVGGGEDGFVTLNHFIKGLTKHARNEKFSTLIVTGPEMSQQYRGEIQNKGEHLRHVQVVDYTPDLMAHMQAANLIVSMAGYNTIVEILAMKKRAIIIPRIKPVLEQLIRAERMDKLGLLKCIHPDKLSSEYLINEVAVQLAHSDPATKTFDTLNFDGLRNLTRVILTLLEGNQEKISLKSLANQTLNQSNRSEEKPCSVFS